MGHGNTRAIKFTQCYYFIIPLRYCILIVNSQTNPLSPPIPAPYRICSAVVGVEAPRGTGRTSITPSFKNPLDITLWSGPRRSIHQAIHYFVFSPAPKDPDSSSAAYLLSPPSNAHFPRTIEWLLALSRPDLLRPLIVSHPMTGGGANRRGYLAHHYSSSCHTHINVFG